VDSSDEGADVEIIGDNWQRNFKPSRVVKGSFLSTVADPDQFHSVRFSPALTWTGVFDVYMSYRPSSTRVSNLKVSVTDTRGTDNMLVDQQQLPNAADATDIYRLLGTYSFVAGSAGGTQSVVIVSTSADRGEKIVVDSVKFVPRCDASTSAEDDLTALALGRDNDDDADTASSVFDKLSSGRGRGSDNTAQSMFVGGVAVGIVLLVVVVAAIFKTTTPRSNEDVNKYVFDDRNDADAIIAKEALRSIERGPRYSRGEAAASSPSPEYDWEDCTAGGGDQTSWAETTLVHMPYLSPAHRSKPFMGPFDNVADVFKVTSASDTSLHPRHGQSLNKKTSRQQSSASIQSSVIQL
jgi:hypothetical protein